MECVLPVLPVKRVNTFKHLALVLPISLVHLVLLALMENMSFLLVPLLVLILSAQIVLLVLKVNMCLRFAPQPKTLFAQIVLQPALKELSKWLSALLMQILFAHLVLPVLPPNI